MCVLGRSKEKCHLLLKLEIANVLLVYCKFGNFRENFIFANSIISHICDVKKSRLLHDLPISVND